MSRVTSILTAAGAVVFASLLAGCGSPNESSSPSGQTTCDPGNVAPTVVWKRTDALLADLGRALELSPEEVCLELGTTPCAKVHRVSLGESDPFDKALYRPFAEPLGTTPLAAERAVLHACVARVDLDRASAQPVVFTHIDLAAASAGDTGAGSAFEKDVAGLGRRFFGRELSGEEIAVLGELALDGSGKSVPADEVAKLVCFTLGTSQEFLFF